MQHLHSSLNSGSGSRRTFLKTGLAAASLLAFPYVSRGRVLGANDRMNIAGIGCGGKGWTDLLSCEGENLVAICDVNSNNLARAAEKFPKAQKFADWREMMDRLGDNVDGFTVSTPDHMHFLPSYRAVKSGRHVYCQKPLTHTLWEARTLTKAAKDAGVVTQMGNQGISHPVLRRDAALLRGGAIGAVKEIHLWTDRPGKWWPQGGLTRPAEMPPVPAGLSWDLWLGKAPERPYHPAYCHFNWRGWRDFGTGAIGDMGCHLLSLPALFMEIGAPVSVDSKCAAIMPESGPAWSEITWKFPAADGRPAWTLQWHDGDKLPAQELFPKARYQSNGIIIVGEKDTYYSSGPVGGGMLRSGRKKEDSGITMDAGEGAADHYKQWIAACKGAGPKPLSRWEIAGPVTEIVLLGQLSLNAGGPVTWEAAALKAADAEGKPLEKLVNPGYRKGWEPAAG